MAGSKSSKKGTSSRADTASSGPGRRVLIKPLSTVGDGGKPTASVSNDLRRVLNFIQDERHLVAHELYMDCKERLRELGERKEKAASNRERTKRSWMPLRKSSTKNSALQFDAEDWESALELVSKHEHTFTVLQQHALLFQSCRDNMDETEEWTLAQTMFGVTTFYRRDSDGSLSIKLEGELKGIPLFEQVCVLREIDLHSHWAPFVTSSLTIAHLDKLDTVGWFMLGLPSFGMARDSCFRAVGCDCVAEDQSVLIVGRGVADRKPDALVDEGTRFLSDDPELKALDIPPVPTTVGSGRMTMKMFEAKIRVLGPDHCHTFILANLDPNLAFLPQPLLEFVMKKLCGLLLNKLQSAAKKIVKDPVRNVHAQRMRDESAFYRDWLLPKFQSIAAEQGWAMPTIAAFELSEAQQVQVEKLKQRRRHDGHSFCQFDSGAASTEGIHTSRSAPSLYHRKSLNRKDDSSDISSLSGTSQSIWKNNPIALYLRDIESKTQARKDMQVQEGRRTAEARLRPKPLPVDKKVRLHKLKAHKMLKLQSRSFSPSDPRSDDDTATPGVIGRSVPLSPVSTELTGRESRPRLWLVFTLLLLLFLLLRGNRFLPTFDTVSGKYRSAILRDVVTLVYLMLCGMVHFLLCHVLLIHAFEAFDLGMKTGAQVKTFYRGRVRLPVAAMSGILVIVSVAKAVLVSWWKSAIIWLFSFFQQVTNKYLDTETHYEKSTLPDGEIVDNGSGDATIIWIVAEALGKLYSAMMAVMYAVFDWQMKFFVRSNMLGRSLERMTTGIYNSWVGLLLSFGSNIHSLVTSDDVEGSQGYSWRDDAIVTLQMLLTYTSVFLLAILLFFSFLSKSYTHRRTTEVPETDDPSAMTNRRSESSASIVGMDGVLSH